MEVYIWRTRNRRVSLQRILSFNLYVDEFHWFRWIAAAAALLSSDLDVRLYTSVRRWRISEMNRSNVVRVYFIDVRNYVELFLAFLCFLGHWCDYIGVRYGARALYNFVFRLDIVLLSLTRIVSTSTHYHLNCHRIESCDATRIRISCEPCTPMGMGHYCGDISLWTSIVWDIWNYDFIHRCWVLRECDSQSMKIYDCITYTCGCIFLPGTFFQLKNVCEFFDNAFFMNTKRIPWFGNQVEKKMREKWTEWKSILY